jgi:GNAT superfamily N-acetyltransferase
MRIVNAAQVPHLQEEMRKLGGSPWCEFLLHSEVMNRLFLSLYEIHPECQCALLDEADGSVIAIGNSVPVNWTDALEELPDTGVEWAVTSRYGTPDPAPANLLCAVQIVVARSHLGTGLSAKMVTAMRALAREQGLSALVAPVRPNWKHRYPLIAMERYVAWTRPDGLPYDPWIRVHARLGARVLRVCRASLAVTGSGAQWQEWTGLSTLESGDYVVEGGLVPMQYDAGQDLGRYVEPNLWMVHL